MKKTIDKIKGKKELEFIYTISSYSFSENKHDLQLSSADPDKIIKAAKNILSKKFKNIIEWDDEKIKEDNLNNYIGCTFTINVNLHKVKAV